MLDHERLDVYQLALRFISWVTVLLAEVRNASAIMTSEACGQLDRASVSVVLNTAEGNAKRQRLIRSKFFDDARGSAAECAACLDVLVAKGACSGERVREGKDMMERIVAMLTRMVQRFENASGVREEEEAYGSSAAEQT